MHCLSASSFSLPLSLYVMTCLIFFSERKIIFFLALASQWQMNGYSILICALFNTNIYQKIYHLLRPHQQFPARNGEQHFPNLNGKTNPVSPRHLKAVRNQHLPLIRSETILMKQKWKVQTSMHIPTVQQFPREVLGKSGIRRPLIVNARLLDFAVPPPDGPFWYFISWCNNFDDYLLRPPSTFSPACQLRLNSSQLDSLGGQ